MSKLTLLWFRINDRIYTSLSRWIYTAIAKLALRLRGCAYGDNLRVDGRLVIRCDKPGAIRIGHGCQFKSRFRSNLIGGGGPCVLDARDNGEIIISDGSGLSFAVISARSRVNIGRRVFIGGNARIFDHDFHSLHPEDRADGERDRRNVRSRPVDIGDDVFIGYNSIILKGVHIGNRAIIGAGSVVTHNVPEGEIWAGNPARRVACLDPYLADRD